jgi:hypothetical protein
MHNLPVQNLSLSKESRRIKYRLMWSYERELREKRRGWWDDQVARRE